MRTHIYILCRAPRLRFPTELSIELSWKRPDLRHPLWASSALGPPSRSGHQPGPRGRGGRARARHDWSGMQQLCAQRGEKASLMAPALHSLWWRCWADEQVPRQPGPDSRGRGSVFTAQHGAPAGRPSTHFTSTQRWSTRWLASTSMHNDPACWLLPWCLLYSAWA